MTDQIVNAETWEERTAREKLEKQARCAVFIEKIEKAFTLCGLQVFGVKEEEDYQDRRQATLPKTSKSAYISASIDRYGHKGRICIGLWFANSLSARDVNGYNAKHEEITLAETKTAEQIASDIKRRLLPTLAESIQKADKVLADRNAYEKKTKKNVALLGGDRPDKNGQQNRSVYFGKGSAEVQGDSVTLSLYSMKATTAKAVIELIKKLEGK